MDIEEAAKERFAQFLPPGFTISIEAMIRQPMNGTPYWIVTYIVRSIALAFAWHRVAVISVRDSGKLAMHADISIATEEMRDEP